MDRIAAASRPEGSAEWIWIAEAGDGFNRAPELERSVLFEEKEN
jgi:hypothetical protein